MRFDSGWVKLWRSAFNEDIGGNIILWGIWTWLLSAASWEESQIIWDGAQRILPTGTVVYGIRELSTRWRISPNTVRRWIKYLHDTGRIVNESCTRGSIITICNWKKYQNSEECVGTPSEHQVNTNCTPSEHQVNTKCTPSDPYEELRIKNIRIKNKELDLNLVHSERASVSIQFDLESLYRDYPRKEGKQQGMKSLRSQIKTQEDYDAFRFAIWKFNKQVEERRTELRFIPLFSTFVLKKWRDLLDGDYGKSINQPTATLRAMPGNMEALARFEARIEENENEPN